MRCQFREANNVRRQNNYKPKNTPRDQISNLLPFCWIATQFSRYFWLVTLNLLVGDQFSFVSFRPTIPMNNKLNFVAKYSEDAWAATIRALENW